MSVSCPVCGEGTRLLYDNMYDDRFGCPTIVQLRRCSTCWHVFTTPSLTPDEIAPLYERYYGRTKTTTLQERPALRNRLWRWILGQNNLGQFVLSPRQHRRLLDVGSGDCQNLWDAVRLGFDAVGIDVDPASTAIGERHSLKVVTGTDIGVSYPGEEFDAVQLNQVLEHYIDPATELSALCRHVHSHGVLFISTPNAGSIFRRLSGRKWINWHVPYHQHHFTKRSLRRLLIRSGWKAERMRTVTPLIWVLLQLRQRGHRPEPGRASESWGGSHVRGSRALEVAALALLLVPVRLLDKLGLGDSMVVTARRTQ